MILALKALAGLLAPLLLLALAVAGGAIAVFCIEGGHGGLSLPALADHLRLDDARFEVESFLAGLERGDSFDFPAFAAGLGAVLLGLALLAGVLVPARERLVSRGGDGEWLSARRRPLSRIARALAERGEGVTEARVKVRAGRRGGGRIRVRADHSRSAEAADVKSAVEGRLAPLAEGFGLRTQVKPRLGGRGSRVQ